MRPRNCPHAALSQTLATQKTHILICRCHSDTKSLACVFFCVLYIQWIYCNDTMRYVSNLNSIKYQMDWDHRGFSLWCHQTQLAGKSPIEWRFAGGKVIKLYQVFFPVPGLITKWLPCRGKLTHLQQGQRSCTGISSLFCSYLISMFS